MNHTETTLEYYNKQAENFTQDTKDVEFSAIQDDFASYVSAGGTILDLGCGSGRDSKAFIERGYRVVAVDGSEEICRVAGEYIGQEVICSTFQEYKPTETFDGIWACSSLLHLETNDIKAVVKRLSENLRLGGCFYASFKYGGFSGMRNGRYFTDMTEESFAEVLQDIPGLRLERQYITSDARPGRADEKWLNVFLVRDQK